MLLTWINSLQFLLAVLSGLLGFYMLGTRRCQALATAMRSSGRIRGGLASGRAVP